MVETPKDDDAFGLYSLIDQDWPQFVRLLPEASDKAVQILHKILTANGGGSRETVFIQLYAQRNGIQLCQN